MWNGIMRRIVSLWFPDYAIERFIRGRMKAGRPPPPKGLPFALVDKGAKGLRLSAVNGVARSFGLHRGQRLADARAQVPDLISEIADPGKDVASLLGLCQWLERYSPWVATDPPDGILLDVTGIPHLFGGEDAMLNGMRARLGSYGFTVRPAIAATIGAAWALARFSPSPARTGEKLDALPIEALRIDGEQARTLHRLGLKTIGALIHIPRASLARRFRGETIAENVLMRLDEALGVRDEPLNPLNPPSSFMAHRTLMEPVITAEGLEAALTGLVAALTGDLERQSQGALRLILKLFRADGARTNVPVGLSAPSHDPRHILRLLMPKLEEIDVGFGIDAMTLEARETGPAIIQQYGFAEDTPSQNLDQLNDRVINRHEAALASLKPVESHVPEKAEMLEDPTRHASHDTLPAMRGGRKKAKFSLPTPVGRVARDSATGGVRPPLLFETPEPATVIAAVPDGPPMRFTWRRATRRVAKSQGPERIAPEWWRLADGERPRDYYIVEDDRGRRYWLYREGLYGEDGEPQPKWFVHGLWP
jgi:protein ImuB